MKRGFTLIELLAVIIILGVIALIATPVILNIVDGSRKSASLSSAKLYIKAVNNSIMNSRLNGNYKIEDGSYIINSSGNICLDASCTQTLEVQANGKKPISGTLEVLNEEVVCRGTELVFSDYTLTCNNTGEYVLKNDNDSGSDSENSGEGGNNSGESGNNSGEGGSSECIGAGCVIGPGGHGGAGEIIIEDSEPEDSEWHGCYKVSASNNAIVDYSTDSSCTKSVVVPSSIDNISITQIWNQAFSNKSITSVKFPNSIIGIGNKAFELNPDLTSIYFQSCPVISSDSFITGIATSLNGINYVQLPNRLCSYNSSSFSLRPGCAEVNNSNSIPNCNGCCFKYPNDTESGLSTE